MISAIVIGRNEGERLRACLQSIADVLATLAHEVIYVDSRSTDDSLSIAREHGARCFLLEDSETTAGLGRYVGAKEARGEYLLFLDGDMRLCPGFVQKAMLAMASRGYDGVTGQREDVYMLGGEVVSRTPNYFGCTAERITPEFSGALFIRADALERCGSWSPDTIACEEAELHARLLNAACRIGELPVPMIVHTDAVRDGRGLLGVLLSRRRLGEGQAMRCAMAHGKGRAYLSREREKFLFYALDWLCLLLFIAGIALLAAHGGAALGAMLPGVLLACACFIQAAQLGFLLARRRVRAFVSQKLFFFAFPAGLLTYRRRSRAYRAV